jgi:hypothetical protein
MKISQEVRDAAAAGGTEAEAERQAGLRDKAEEFRRGGSRLYVPQA